MGFKFDKQEYYIYILVILCEWWGFNGIRWVGRPSCVPGLCDIGQESGSFSALSTQERDVDKWIQERQQY